MVPISFFQAKLRAKGNAVTSEQSNLRRTLRRRTSSRGVSIQPSKYPNHRRPEGWCIENARAASARSSSGSVDKSNAFAGRGTGYVYTVSIRQKQYPRCKLRRYLRARHRCREVHLLSRRQSTLASALKLGRLATHRAARSRIPPPLIDVLRSLNCRKLAVRRQLVVELRHRRRRIADLVDVRLGSST